MDIVRFKGGLGNQMFQYALMEGLRSKGRCVKSSLGFYRNHPDLMPFVLDRVFPNLEMDEIEDELFDEKDNEWKKIKQDDKLRKEFENDIKNCFFYVEKNSRTYYPEIFLTQNCTFIGYWQTEKYFSEIKGRIKDLFEFDVQDIRLRNLGNKLNNGYVGVHVRRGDYLQNPKFQVCDVEYYKKAMQMMKEMKGDVEFVFFSDDAEWVKKTFGYNTFVLEKDYFSDYQDWYDMYLMSSCGGGNIICNSTFSWWAAWLNKNKNKEIIAPETWNLDCETPDILCEEWIHIKNV